MIIRYVENAYLVYGKLKLLTLECPHFPILPESLQIPVRRLITECVQNKLQLKVRTVFGKFFSRRSKSYFCRSTDAVGEKRGTDRTRDLLSCEVD